MKKTIFTVALMALMLFTTSSYKSGAAGIEKGAIAPNLQISNSSKDVQLSNMRGGYVLLTFWSSADAASRVECNKYSTWFNANKPSNFSHIAVNLDKDESLFKEIARRDQLDEKAQFNVHGKEASRIVKDFNLANGYGSILIGPDGRIVEFNPNVTDLTSLI